MKNYLLFFLFSISSCLCAQNKLIKALSAKEAKQDISYFERLFLSAHPTPEIVCDTNKLKAQLDSIKSEIKDSIFPSKLYTKIVPILSQIEDIHFNLFLSDSNNDYYNNNNLYLPLSVYILDGNIYLKENLDSICQKGMQIVSINNIGSELIVSRLSNNFTSDGKNKYSKERSASRSFFKLFPLYFNVNKENIIHLQTESGMIQYMLKGITKKSEKFEKFEKKSSEINIGAKYPFSFGYTLDRKIAYMRISTFMGENPGEFNCFLKRTFTDLNYKKPTALVLDLRNNVGGFINYGEKLTRYLMPKTYNYCTKYSGKPSSFMQREIIKNQIFQPEYTKFILKTLSGIALRMLWDKDEGVIKSVLQKSTIPIRNKKQYNNTLVVLFNEYSASTSGLVINTLKQRENTIFIGIPAGCRASGSFGQPIGFILPNSKIQGYMSVLKIDSNTKIWTSEPIMPDIIITSSTNDYKNNKDTQLNEAFKYLRESIK